MSSAVRKSARARCRRTGARTSAAARRPRCGPGCRGRPSVLSTAVEDAVEVGVRVTSRGQHQRTVDRGGEVANALLDTLALKGECQLGAFAGERLGDGPGDASTIGDAENQPAAAFQQRHGPRVAPSHVARGPKNAADGARANLTHYDQDRCLASSRSIPTPRKSSAKLPRAEAHLVTDFGLEGDRHAGRPRRQVSILNAETVDELAANAACPSSPAFSAKTSPSRASR